MDLVLRAAIVYVTLLIIFRLTGKRSLSETTPFDLVLLLIFAEALESALVDEDHSVTGAFIVILTLVVLDIGMSLVKQRWLGAEKLLEGLPLVVMDNGELLEDRMKKARIDEGDILAAARESQGIDSLGQIRMAVLERSGVISIIPKRQSA